MAIPEAHSSHRIVLLEQSRAVQAVLRKYLEDGGFQVEAAGDVEGTLGAIARMKPEAVLAGAEGPERLGETACSRIKAEIDGKLPVVLLYEPGDDDAERRAAAAGADSYLVAPLKRHGIVAVTRDMVRIRHLLEENDALERKVEALGGAREAPRQEPQRPQVGGEQAYDFEFFKKLLLMEVKRSKRYNYPISLGLVGFDGFATVTAELGPRDRGRVVGSLLALVTRCVRDIDLPVLYAEDRILVFMPHTPREGAGIVGQRLRDQVREHVAEVGERIRVTASVGIAAYEGRGTVSFGSLIKDATAALREAQLAGGDQVAMAAAEPEPRVSNG